jgi:sporulation protein YlmC with PRC-barrel domain
MFPRPTVPTLLLLLASAPAFAQDTVPALTDDRPSQLEQVGLTPPTVMSEGHEVTAEEVMVSTVLGQTLYTGVEGNAAVIGTVEDLVIGPLGDITAAIVEVGAFLDTGSKEVAVAFADIQRVPVNGSIRWTLETTREALAAAPVFEPPDETASAEPLTETEEANQVAEGDAGATTLDPELTTDQPEAGASASADMPDPTPAELIGLGVYGQNDQPIGTINSLVETPDGEIDAIVIDVGGFLGLGAKPVAVAYENRTFATDSSGGRYLFLNTTREALEAQPVYDPGTYEENRAEQRMVVTP